MEISRKFIGDARKLREDHEINPAGEGGEFETLVLNCPMFSRPLRVVRSKVTGSGNSFRMEVELE
jgi:diphthamide synthase (EF-2-diphthine--ammonia ligase)